MQTEFDPKAHNPQFHKGMLKPTYWGTWLNVLLLVLISLLPYFVRRTLVSVLARVALKINSKANKRARVNLSMCFPEKSQAEREAILLKSLLVGGNYLLAFPRLSLHDNNWLEKHTNIVGLNNLTQYTDNKENVILLIPHTWALDIPGVIFASRQIPTTAMAKKQKNEVMDWLINRQRIRYGGYVYERSQGIKPFLRSIKQGYLGCYLPDEDLGAENSVFVDFFATQKATIKGLGKLSKLTKAKVVPVFSMFNLATGQFELDILPALTPFPNDSEEQDARMMNACIENYVNEHPEQYMWILRLLKTRPNNGENPYNQ
ncbi:lauroyl-Kdo(2)-lipid IV(A) myristoyltransferase [Motilimonas sp. 1_MG-2023]|uniref:lauroyl-Kdo(2)-lipid IV(A) myristoyltransferase n=1 Tax=Motilimonas TaxID=1914248 RepID=UPI0026E16683|nr:lauroyl-Kdo(2)-lipid IV(A) myristoyltransferase [Motilimonas sp. 1_MG-2023]MDO6526822.1 lauroyl-Kdo(2)-lipid IV(A) myristoyltransferase [Motilimonas sp. 1_MG-2023]